MPDPSPQVLDGEGQLGWGCGARGKGWGMVLSGFKRILGSEQATRKYEMICGRKTWISKMVSCALWARPGPIGPKLWALMRPYGLVRKLLSAWCIVLLWSFSIVPSIISSSCPETMYGINQSAGAWCDLEYANFNNNSKSVRQVSTAGVPARG